ncbi:sugar phosphate isomerase/epimerase family protein [Agrobacterium tumefaciens]|uniref:sugar phosphate isomerase/epimerase family protein n=1 Tax=Agrobacterium tumefaciens TaxID=358 RepID=UPI001572E87A|nr:TIM barrel protein [Agrobacterium tumefaciens]NTD85908.1 TIM barrel protein [Agrobacterium tumefaciens]NTD91732.1 TIM barrel protein [Agrobacterium tumefaciens]NTD98457.1 TIM barrel protein [Agrobacterium tumefaciens]NTE16780.1 TIM barrel protein [Agrobacterium tumefaciens]NTE17179.1 TIM barrel protein [Agrobacterium tumefaciens]
MGITVTTAPCCWGVDDVRNPNLPPWEMVFDEVKAAEYGGVELGPYGYVPLNIDMVSQALTSRGLYIVAGTIFNDLVAEENRDSLLRQTDEICALITRLPTPPKTPGQRFPAPYLTVMDWGHDERDYAAGHSDRAPRLDDAAWNGMMDNIRAISALAREKYGVRATIHPHAGGYIEFEDEIARLAIDIPQEVAGFCLDTGHTWYAGMDPVQTLRKYADRLDYIHFKDIDRAVFGRVMGEHIRFFEACAQGVMCPIGKGCIDYPAIRALLDELGYEGFITVEQERDPRNAGGSLADVKLSRDYLKSAGF